MWHFTSLFANVISHAVEAAYMGARSTKDGFGMTIEQVSQQILNLFVVPVYSLLLVTIVGALAGGAGFIINLFQRRDMQTQDIGGKRRA